MGLDPVTMLAGSSLISGLMGADAASNAADTQANAANQATALQKSMFDTTSGYEAPYRNIGAAAGYKLADLLGLNPASYGGSAPGDSAGGMDAATLRAQLLPQYTHTVSDPSTYTGVAPSAGAGPATTVDEAGLNAAIQQRMAQGGSAGGGPIAPNADTGSLLKNFGMSDFQLDPGIQFQLKYGQQALQNSQAARDGVLSGGALKDLMSFNQGLAGTGYQSAYDRYMQNKGFNYDALMKLSNLGQSAASNTANTGANYAQGISSSLIGAGQASAAGQVGVANALAGGIGGGANAYFLSSLLGKGGIGTNTAAPGAMTPYSGDPMSYTG